MSMLVGASHGSAPIQSVACFKKNIKSICLYVAVKYYAWTLRNWLWQCNQWREETGPHEEWESSTRCGISQRETWVWHWGFTRRSSSIKTWAGTGTTWIGTAYVGRSNGDESWGRDGQPNGFRATTWSTKVPSQQFHFSFQCSCSKPLVLSYNRHFHSDPFWRRTLSGILNINHGHQT